MRQAKVASTPMREVTFSKAPNLQSVLWMHHSEAWPVGPLLEAIVATVNLRASKRHSFQLPSDFSGMGWGHAVQRGA